MVTQKVQVRRPEKWDADCIECPFADQDNLCSLAFALSGETVIYCNEDGNKVDCPLNNGPVEISMAPIRFTESCEIGG